MEITELENKAIIKKLAEIIGLANRYAEYEKYSSTSFGETGIKTPSESLAITLSCIKYKLEDIYKIIEKNISDDRKEMYGYN